MRDRHRAGLLRVVDEVALGIERGVFSHDLHRVLVRADRAVAAEPVKHGADHVVRFGRERRVVVEAQVRHVVLDAHGEVLPRGVLGRLVENRLDHRRREFLRREPVTAADHPRRSAGPALGQRGHHVQVERLAQGARLLRPVEHGQRLDGFRHGVGEGLGVERPVEPHLDQADLRAPRGQIIDGLLDHARSGAHRHDHLFRVGGADVVEQVVLPAGERGELVHHALDDLGHPIVERVARLAGLEEDVRVLGRAPQLRLVRIQGAVAMRLDELQVDHRLDVVAGELLDLVHFVRGPEPVEIVEEGNAGFESRGICQKRHILGLLNAVGRQEGPAGRAAGHDVAMIAENRQRVRRHRPRGDMEHRRGELPGDLEHVGNHQQQALRGRERACQCTCLKRAMNGAGGARLTLHLHNVRNRAEDVLLSGSRPGVRKLAHAAGGSDRVDSHHLVAEVGDRRRRFIAIDGHEASFCHGSVSLSSEYQRFPAYRAARQAGSLLGLRRAGPTPPRHGPGEPTKA